METFAEAITQFRSAEAGGFNVSDAQTASLLNEGAKRFAARSEHLRAFLTIGVTVAGQNLYELPAKQVRAKVLYVGNVPWTLVDLLQLKEVEIGRRQLDGQGGIYAEEASEDGLTKKLRLFPAPEEDGVQLQTWGSILPDTLAGADVLPFGVEYNRGIVDFAKAIAYEDLDENVQGGASFLERANGRADELKEADKRRLGRNPRRAQVATLRGR